MHPNVKSILQYFHYDHLPADLAEVSKPFCDLAHKCAETLEGPELGAGLRQLLIAKDSMVRAALTENNE